MKFEMIFQASTRALLCKRTQVSRLMSLGKFAKLALVTLRDFMSYSISVGLNLCQFHVKAQCYTQA